MQIAGAKGVHVQGQPGAGPRLTLLGLLLGSVWGFVRGQVRPDQCRSRCWPSRDQAPRAALTSTRLHIPSSNERP